MSETVTTYALSGGDYKNGKFKPFTVIAIKSPDQGYFNTEAEAKTEANRRNRERKNG